jgi:hypothetical protein
MFENRVLRRTFGPQREEVAGGWRRLHIDGIHNLNASVNNITETKSRRKRRDRYFAHLRVTTDIRKNFSWEN